jgi:hypothetical protein
MLYYVQGVFEFSGRSNYYHTNNNLFLMDAKAILINTFCIEEKELLLLYPKKQSLPR